MKRLLMDFLGFLLLFLDYFDLRFSVYRLSIEKLIGSCFVNKLRFDVTEHSLDSLEIDLLLIFSNSCCEKEL